MKTDAATKLDSQRRTDMDTGKRNVVCSVLAVLLFAVTSLGQQSGGVPIRIPDQPTPRCINYNTDQVWLTLYRVVTMKTKHFLSTENQAEILIKVLVKTSPEANPAISYPLSAKVNIRAYPTGQVSLPVEYLLVNGLALKQGNVVYNGFGVDATLVNLRSRHGLGSALQALTDITGANKLPIPSSPYTQAAGYLLQFANAAVTNDINDKNGDDKLATASLALSFDPEGSCTGSGPGGQGFETTGTKAILLASGTLGEGLVPIDKTDAYCWTADVTPVFEIKAAKKTPGTSCTDAGYADKYKLITNDYIAFFLQKREIARHLGHNDIANRDLQESKKLCDVLGLKRCPAARR